MSAVSEGEAGAKTVFGRKAGVTSAGKRGTSNVTVLAEGPTAEAPVQDPGLDQDLLLTQAEAPENQEVGADTGGRETTTVSTEKGAARAGAVLSRANPTKMKTRNRGKTTDLLLKVPLDGPLLINQEAAARAKTRAWRRGTEKSPLGTMRTRNQMNR